MKFFKFFLVALATALLVPATGLAQRQIFSCSQDSLKRMTALYITAQTKGDRSVMPFVSGLDYKENAAASDVAKGIINKPMNIDFHRSIFDESTCQTYTEVLVANKEEPYAMGVRMRVVTGKISELEIIWTTKGHWLFQIDNYLKYSPAEKWDVIPVEKRDTRETLLYAANSYLDAFVDANLDIVPWGYPCVRIEGGATTAPNGETPQSGCEAGVPSGVNIVNRHYVIDESMGSIAVFCTFGAGTPGGGSGAPDLHQFRLENGKLRYVHTMTHLLQSDFQGPMPKGSEYTNSKGSAGKPKTQ